MGQSPSFDKLSDLHEMSLDKTGQKPHTCNLRVSRKHTDTEHMKAPCETAGVCELKITDPEEHKEIKKTNIVVTKSTFYDQYG